MGPAVGECIRAHALRTGRARSPRVRAARLLFAMLLLATPAPHFAVVGQTPARATVARATVGEEVRVLETYPFFDPNPVPVLVRDARLYPYHTFEGYSAESEPREWKVVVLENALVRVFVLPEIGGKVWGAVVKETGREFVYRNEVVKFRNIALRGPWTSGGIEFNFGVIGHAPSTATPVDYALRENEDGSASVFVGAADLPSRTRWHVEVRLPPDQAAFETRAFWHNPTSLEQPYYNWMTAAAFARDDLELFVPGASYLEHSGRRRPWPVVAGRRLSLYRDNDFGGHKSYHVVGELNDFFGGYYHDEGWGWGHWARHEDMPGRKMWLWALSREGGVWEDLLTDSDGQYVEFQAGRLWVQYSPGDHVNPISQAGFDPVSASSWTETWFPVQGLGGLSAASRLAAMHVSAEEAGEAEEIRVNVALHAFGDATDTLEVWSDGRRIAATEVRLEALRPFEADFPAPADKPFQVRLSALDLRYDSDPASRALSRPFETSPAAWDGMSEAARRVFEGRQLAKGRQYSGARRAFARALDAEPWNRDALLGMAELALRSGRYEEGAGHVSKALQLDAYDPKANFLAGALHWASGRTADARDAFGWSARSVAYRAASYVRLARIMVAERRWDEAKRYAARALEFDARGVSALEVTAVVGRATGDTAAARRALAEVAEIDPLHHFVAAEEYLAAPSPASERRLMDGLRGEYPAQALLELAVGHADLGRSGDAARLLELAARRGANPVIAAWRAYLAQNAALLDEPGDPAFAFPFRPETLPVLRWAAERNRHWTWRYLLALELWALDRTDEATRLFESLGDEPDYGPAYAARGLFLQETRGRDPAPDLARAVSLAPDSRPLRIAQIREAQNRAQAAGVTSLGRLGDRRRPAAQQQDRAQAARVSPASAAGGDADAWPGAWRAALEMSAAALEAFPGDYDLELLRARALVLSGACGPEALGILERVQALPSENSRDNRKLFVAAHLTAAACQVSAEGPRADGAGAEGAGAGAGGTGAERVGPDATADRDAATAGWSAAKVHLEAALGWPENLGQGRPYEPDDRTATLLLASSFDDALGPNGRRRLLRAVVDATPALVGAVASERGLGDSLPGPGAPPPDDSPPGHQPPDEERPPAAARRILSRADLPATLALYALGRRDALANLGRDAAATPPSPDGLDPPGAPAADPANAPAAPDDADRMVRQAAAWLADPELDRCGLPARLVERFPEQFQDVDGRILLVGLRLATSAWALGRPAPSRC